MPAGTAGGASASPVRLLGVAAWETAVFQSDGQRWVALSLNLLDEEPMAMSFSPEDAEAIGRALINYAHQAEMRDLGDLN